jgi:hypothetical protein
MYCHISRSSGPYPPAREGYGATTCFTALDPASLLGRALMLPRLPQLRTLPPRSGGLRCCHVSHGFRPYLPAQEGSDAAMCPTALDPASLLRRVPALSCVPRLRTQRPYSGGFQRCHVPHGFGPCLPARVGSDAATCPIALNGSGALGIKKGLAGVGM